MKFENTETCSERSCCLDCCREAFLGLFRSFSSFLDCTDVCRGDDDGCDQTSDLERLEGCFAGLTFKNPGIPFYYFESLAVGCRSNGTLALNESALYLTDVSSFCVQTLSGSDVKSSDMALLGGFVGCAVFFALIGIIGVGLLVVRSLSNAKRSGV